jgi:Domain of unknown function (DUF2828)
MAFIKAMNSPAQKKLGVNGANVYTEEGVGDYLVTLFTMLNRGLEYSYITENVSKIFNRGVESEMRDLFVMAFQTRDVRGGKGEKKLFYYLLKSLALYDMKTVKAMISLIPEYGCWRDMWELMSSIEELENTILEITFQTFKDDLVKAHSNQQSKMSLLAKWLPREGSGTYKGMARKLANYFYNFDNSERKRMVKYRKDTSFMNKMLKTIEINMCAGKWSEIKPEAVPGRSLKIHKKAFLNESLKKNAAGVIRFPDNEDRMTCRQHFLEFVEALNKGEKKAHGANVVMPHELVLQALSRNNTKEELAINQGQWVSIREESLKLGGLTKCVPMCDFSGSMDGLPKLISLSLGILISEINHPTFRDHILTFDSEPIWHSFAGMSSLKEKLESIGYIGQGLNTNFFKACMLILEKMVQNRVPVGEEPEDLIVLTDMGFDTAGNSYSSTYDTSIDTSVDNSSNKWLTVLDKIRQEFARANKLVWGDETGWKIPRIVIWNLRAQYKDFHAKADEEGVVQLSGWSPSILKALQNGSVKVMTPYEGLRAVLDDERYDPVRQIWSACHSSASTASTASTASSASSLSHI